MKRSFSDIDSEQTSVLTCLMHSKNNIFMTGPSGVGKSFTIEIIKKALQKMKVNYLTTSSTALSAKNVGGQTLHSLVRFGFVDESRHELDRKIHYATTRTHSPVTNTRTLPETTQTILKLEALIIDEISMISASFFENMSYIFSRIRNNDNLPFGGIRLIIVGDFAQLAPVTKSKSAVPRGLLNITDQPFAKHEFAFETKAWDLLKIRYFILNKVHRQENVDFVTLLNKIRLGEMDNDVIEKLNKRVFTTVPQIDAHIDPVYLFGKNMEIDRFNRNKLDEIKKPICIFEFKIKMVSPSGENWDGKQSTYKHLDKIYAWPKREYTDAKNKHFRHQRKFIFKETAQVIFTRNVSITDNVINGTRGIINSYDKIGKTITVLLENGSTYVCKMESETLRLNSRVVATWECFPLKLGYALSIHKSQGMTLDHVVTSIDDDNIFEHGQAYTVLSRIKNLENLYLKNFDPSVIKVNKKVVDFYKKIKVIRETQKLQCLFL